MDLPDVFVGVGGNIGDSLANVRFAMEQIRKLPFLFHFRSSQLYRTTPVSSIPQGDYTNAVCTFRLKGDADFLLAHLQAIERLAGKEKKRKDEPRVIDLDILLFGKQTFDTVDLQIPHPRFMDRLFVLAPLRDLTETIWIPEASCPFGGRLLDLTTYLANFPNIYSERVNLIEEEIAISIHSA